MPKSMRALLVAVLALAGSSGWPAPDAATRMLEGKVLEVLSVEVYTYLRLESAQGEVWVAVPKSNVDKGARVAVENPLALEQFESKSLGKTFDRILFGTLASPGAKPPPTVAPIAKATGPQGRTVAEVISGKEALKDKVVLVRGQVVKVSSGILGKTWMHLQDGSGAAAAGTHDLLVTTTDNAAVGDVIVARGTVRTDVQLGAGYAYAVLIEDASLRK